MFLFQRSLNGHYCSREMTDIGLEKGHRRFDCHTHLGQFYIYNIYIKPLWLKSNSRFTCKWIKKVIFCLLFVSIDEKPFFGTYALDISSLTSSIKYISEKYKNLWLCFFFSQVCWLKNKVRIGKILVPFQEVFTSIRSHLDKISSQRFSYQLWKHAVHNTQSPCSHNPIVNNQ